MGKTKRIKLDPRVQQLIDSITLPKEIRQSASGHHFLYVNGERVACISGSGGPSTSRRMVNQNVVDIKKFLKKQGI